MKLFTALLVAAISSVAFAHGNAASQTAAAVSLATETFEKDAALLQKFTGVKAWPVGDQIRVRFYLNDNSTVEYGCHEMNGQFMCMK